MRRWGPLLCGLLLACDPAAPQIFEVRRPDDGRDAAGPYQVTAITRGAVDEVSLFWTPEGGAEAHSEVELERHGNEWSGGVPGQPAGTNVLIWIVAKGPGGEARHPKSGAHRFRVLAPTGECLVDGDCVAGEICDGDVERCKQRPERCESDEDCPQDMWCPAAGQLCRFRPTLCEAAADCGEGQDCEGGRCVSRPECREDAECEGRCLTPPGRCVQCLQDADCASGNCDGTVCREDVMPDDCPGGCPPGFECREGACFEVEVDPCEACPEGTVCVDERCQPAEGCGRGCDAGTRCDPEMEICVECFADGHCGSGEHCLIEQRRCAEGARVRTCAPCGREGCGNLACEPESGACAPRCSADRECGDLAQCRGGVCTDFGFGACFFEECFTDEDCASRVCNGGRCEATQVCRVNEDCAAERQCRGGLCVERQSWCEIGFDCGGREVCLAGRCVPQEERGPVCSECDGPQDCGPQAYCSDLQGFLFEGPRCLTACNEGTCPRGFFCEFFAPGFSFCAHEETGSCEGFGGDCDDDQLEENDSEDEATVIGNGAQIRGTLCPEDEDWFRLRTRNRQSAVVEIDVGGDGLQFQIVLEAGRVLSGGVVEGSATIRVPAQRDNIYLRLYCPGCVDAPGYALSTRFEGG